MDAEIIHRMLMNNFSFDLFRMLYIHRNFTVYYKLTHYPYGVFLGAVTPGLSYLTLLSNIFVVYIFTKHLSRTPTTVLLVALAISDTLTGLLCNGLNPFIDFYFRDGYQIYPQCLIFSIITGLSPVFRYISVLLTTSLTCLRFVVVRCPFRGPVCWKVKTSLILVIVFSIFVILAYVPPYVVIIHESLKSISTLQDMRSLGKPNTIKFTDNSSNLSGDICVQLTVEYDESLYDMMMYAYRHVFFFTSICSCCCCCVIIVLTLYLILKFRKNNMASVRNVRRAEHAKKLRATIMITLIVLFFLIAEIPQTLYYVCFVPHSVVFNFFGSSTFCNDLNMRLHEFFVYPETITYITFQISALSNIWIYIFMSEDFRSAFFRCFRR